MFNLSDSLGRPLFANIQVRATATRFASARSSDAPHPARKDLTRLRGVPEDRRARKVSHSNPRCCPRLPQPQPLSFCRCTHKLAEVRDHKAVGKASTSFTHPFALLPRRCQDGCRQTKWRLSRASLPTTPRCCFGSQWASRPTAPTRLTPRTSSTPSSTDRASATFRATSTLSTTRTPTCARPLACNHSPCFCLIPSVVLYSECARGGRPFGRRRLAVCRLLGDSAAEWDGRGAGLGSTSHKGVLPRYDSNARGQLPSRSPR